jgi:TPR repeat protein
MFKIGTILLNGTLGQTRNPREGVNWLKRAAMHTDDTTPHALHELAMLHQSSSIEVTKFMVPDPIYAQELFLKSGQLGYAPSQYQLGLAYEYGYIGLPVDPRRSIAWYSKAAAQGDPEAELALSGWYLTGFSNVLQRNEHEAYLWARKAADKGLAKAEYAVGYFLGSFFLF